MPRALVFSFRRFSHGQLAYPLHTCQNDSASISEPTLNGRDCKDMVQSLRTNVNSKGHCVNLGPDLSYGFEYHAPWSNAMLCQVELNSRYDIS